MQPALPFPPRQTAEQRPSRQSVQFPSTTTPLELDELLQRVHHAKVDSPQALLLDLSGVRFLLVECLPALISEIAARHAAGLKTAIRLPQHPDVRGILRTWRFPQALRNVTDVQFVDYVVPQDHKYFHWFGGDQETREFGLRKWFVGGQVLSVDDSTERFFSLRHWKVQDFKIGDSPSRFQRAVLDECTRWVEDSVIKSMLIHHLGEYHGYVWSHVIHEAMSNAFRHGQAKTVLSASKADFDKKTQRDRFLTLVFWDDGIPIYQSLAARLKINHSIIGSAFEKAEPLSYRAKIELRDGQKLPEIVISSKQLPNPSSQDHEVLLATLYPGVSSDPEGREHFHHEETEKRSGSVAVLPGMGLANLINGAIDILGGSVAFRSGDYFMNVKGAGARAKGINYKVKIEKRWPFSGNMVTVRLPLRGQ
ncbi:MAG: hypothetical protein AB7K64_12900 [Variibacter sp.]